MSNTPIELKGSSFTLSVIHLHNAPPEVIYQALVEKIAQAPAFLKHAPVVVNVSALNCQVDWPQIQEMVSSAGLHIVGVSGCKDPELKAIINAAGLPLLTEGKEKAEIAARKPAVEAPAPQPIAAPVTKTRLIDTPIRSGQRIYAPNCDLIVTNHVSAGAELIADGNIHVYGMLRGRALAGASGDRNTQIFCTNLTAELVSIAGVYWLSEKIPADYFGKSARLRLSDADLSIQPLD